MLIQKKTWSEMFQKILDGDKTFEYIEKYGPQIIAFK